MVVIGGPLLIIYATDEELEICHHGKICLIKYHGGQKTRKWLTVGSFGRLFCS
jgi:hypothetical protein